MLALGLGAGILAVFLLLWGIGRWFGRLTVRWNLLGFVVLLGLSFGAFYLHRPHYVIVSQTVSLDDVHGYQVRVSYAPSEAMRLERDAAVIVATVRSRHPDANAVRINFYPSAVAPIGNGYDVEATWAPAGNWQTAVQAAKGASGAVPRPSTSFLYVLAATQP